MSLCVRKLENPDGSEMVMLGNIIWAEKPSRKNARRSEWAFSPAVMRLREIEKVIAHRHGSVIPDPAGTDDRDTCVAYIKAAAFSLTRQPMHDWCRRWAPWATSADILDIVSQAETRKRMMTSDGVAGLLCVSWAERTKLNLTTIGACDMTAAKRVAMAKERKRERDRIRQEAKRRAEGRRDRKAHAGTTLHHSKPWEKEGISRATWFRRNRETQLSQAVYNMGGDIRVSNVSFYSLNTARFEREVPFGFMADNMDGAAVHDAGLGEHHPTEFQEAEPHGSSDIKSQLAA